MSIYRKRALPLGAAALLIAMTSVPALADPDSVNPTIIQSSGAVTITDHADHTATVGGNAANGATGTAGFNVMSGDANQQTNIVNVQTSSGSNAAGPTSTIFNMHQSPGNAGGYNQISADGSNTATINGNAALNMTGNAAVNVTAGDANEQSNALIFNNKGTAFVQNVPYGTSPTDVINNTQTGPNTAIYADGQNYTANVGGNAAQGGHGNVGLNASAGVMNMQQNQMYFSEAANAGNQSTTSAVNSSVVQQTGTTAAPTSPATAPPYTITDYEYTGNGTHKASIDGNVGKGMGGNLAVNAASGIANEQLNSATLLTNVTGGNPQLTQSLLQGNLDGTFGTDGNVRLSAGDQITTHITSNIGGNAGQSASGMVDFNSAAGVQNAQANLATFINDKPMNGNVGAPSLSQNVQQSLDSATRPDGNGGTSPGLNQQSSTFSSQIDGNAGSGASGIVGMNSASGMFNQQGNALMFVNGAGDLSGTQSGTQRPNQALGQYVDSNPNAGINGPSSSTSISQNNSSFDAGITGSAGQNANGAIGANSTSGAGNMQSNEIMLLTGDTKFGDDMNSTQQIGQIGNPLVTQTGTTSSTAHIGGSAFSGAQGVVSANVSSGAINQQGNITILATSNLTDTAPNSNQQLYTLGINQNPKATPSSGSNKATIDGNAFAGATGQVSANVAAGVGNQQLNALSIVK